MHLQVCVKSKKDQCKSKHVKKNYGWQQQFTDFPIYSLPSIYKINPAKEIHQDVICESSTIYI